MNDDLIMRLRVATAADTAEGLYQLMTEAADEIERLTALLSARKVADDTYVRTEWSGEML